MTYRSRGCFSPIISCFQNDDVCKSGEAIFTFDFVQRKKTTCLCRKNVNISVETLKA